MFKIHLYSEQCIKELDVSVSTFVIGRSQDCDICLDAKGVSRRHLSVSTTKGKIWITDLGSANGTYVEGDRIFNEIPYLYNPEHVIRLGKNKEVFTIMLKENANTSSFIGNQSVVHDGINNEPDEKTDPGHSINTSLNDEKIKELEEKIDELKGKEQDAKNSYDMNVSALERIEEKHQSRKAKIDIESEVRELEHKVLVSKLESEAVMLKSKVEAEQIRFDSLKSEKTKLEVDVLKIREELNDLQASILRKEVEIEEENEKLDKEYENYRDLQRDIQSQIIIQNDLNNEMKYLKEETEALYARKEELLNDCEKLESNFDLLDSKKRALTEKEELSIELFRTKAEQIKDDLNKEILELEEKKEKLLKSA